MNTSRILGQSYGSTWMVMYVMDLSIARQFGVKQVGKSDMTPKRWRHEPRSTVGVVYTTSHLKQHVIGSLVKTTSQD
jgi:hypothetical protein